MKPFSYSFSRKGFTLVEMLIVIAIIGILASVVLVGLGPVQKKGRDARRISDLREVQTGLELSFNKNGSYPPSSDWTTLTNTLKAANIGVSNVPDDPRAGIHYLYASNGTSYVVAATLEDTNNAAFNQSILGQPIAGMTFTCGNPIYCVGL